MTLAVVLGIAMALAYALLNGVIDAAAAVAMPVATRVARPLAAVAVAAAGNLLGPLVVGTAVAATIAGIVEVEGADGVAVLGAGLTSAVAWCAGAWWQGLPVSAGHALVGGLTGAALVAGGLDGVAWGGLDGWRPVGVVGTLLALLVSVVLGLLAGVVADRFARRALRRATAAVRPGVGWAQWASAGALAFGHGANDAQKAVGAIVAVLYAADRQDDLTVPGWAPLVSAAAMTVGTVLGGWSIVRTIGRRIVRVRSVDGLVAQGSSATVVLASSFVGAPVSTPQVLASSVVGAGVGHRRGRHVRWAIVGRIALSWVVTLPVSAALAAALLPLWRWLS